MQLYIDLDGVLADFHGHFVKEFGFRLDTTSIYYDYDSIMWTSIRSKPNFFIDIPLMPDALDIWYGIKHLNPIILSGSHTKDITDQKGIWVSKYFQSAPLICCLSGDKFKYCSPGDIIIDDWPRYRPEWERAGGIFILHKSACESLLALEEVLNGHI